MARRICNLLAEKSEESGGQEPLPYSSAYDIVLLSVTFVMAVVAMVLVPDFMQVTVIVVLLGMAVWGITIACRACVLYIL